MAKKKKTRKKTTRRRKMSGIGGDTVQTVIGAAAGAVGGNMLADKMAENMPSIKPNLIIAGQALVGAALFAKVKNPLIKALGLGLVGSAAIKGAQSFGFLSGIGNNSNLVTFSADRMNGLQNSMAGDGFITDESLAGLDSVMAGMM